MTKKLTSGDVKVENPFGNKQIKVTRFAGDLKKAYLEEDGTTVGRKEFIVIPPFEDMPEPQQYPAAPYDNHFVFRHVYRKKGVPIRGWTLWCTCGSPAIIADYSAYSQNASDSGRMVLCYHHAQYGRHADGSS